MVTGKLSPGRSPIGTFTVTSVFELRLVRRERRERRHWKERSQDIGKNHWHKSLSLCLPLIEAFIQLIHNTLSDGLTESGRTFRFGRYRVLLCSVVAPFNIPVHKSPLGSKVPNPKSPSADLFHGSSMIQRIYYGGAKQSSIVDGYPNCRRARFTDLL